VTPLVTIITATYNAKSLLSATIESIRRQSYENIEWIVIDGNSSDSTLSLIKENEDIIDYWVSESDAGIYDAWNKGIRQARGEWIAFIGAGDLYHPDAISTFIAAINNCKFPIQLATSRIRFIDEFGKYKKIVGKKFNWYHHQKRMNIAHVGAMHHRSLFENYGLFDATFKVAADYEFFFRFGGTLNSIHLKAITVDMLIGGISSGYRVLHETYCIQRKYGSNVGALIRYAVAVIKKAVRPFFLGY
jgi:glycosyltransferase involved in cell wall biosynthesis